MDQVTVAKSEFRLRQWANLIKARQDSGQTVVAWCAEHEISTKTYYYWLRKLRLRAMENQNLPVVSEPNTTTSFKKLDVQAPLAGTQSAVIMHLPNATLEIQNGASQQTVEAVLLALKNLC